MDFVVFEVSFRKNTQPGESGELGEELLHNCS